jgi:hypothetical protein
MVKLTDKPLDMGNSAKFNRPTRRALSAPVSAVAGLGVGYAPRP